MNKLIVTAALSIACFSLPAAAIEDVHAKRFDGTLTYGVFGSTNAPATWLRLTIDTRSDPVTFSWMNVPYCKNPTTSCN